MIKDEAIQRIKTAWQDEFGPPMTGDDADIARIYAIAIRALMDADKPLPVDTDLLLARKIVADELAREGCPLVAARVLAGRSDDDYAVCATLAGIKAGKAMR